MAASPPKIVGLALAGGRSRRFSGANKAFAELSSRPLISYALDVLRSTNTIAISANQDIEKFTELGHTVLTDEMPDLGPLGGIYTGLKWAETQSASWLLTVPVDTPFLPHNLVDILSVNTDEVDIISAKTDHTQSPVCALWRTSLRQAMQAAIFDEGIRRMTEFLSSVRWQQVHLPTQLIDPLFNINTQEALSEANALLARNT